MSENIIIALIGVGGIFVTIIGSIITIQIGNYFSKKQQRILDMRKIKLEYYHKFVEVLAQKYNYMLCPNSKEAVKANLDFVLEVNRLPLYASQEVVDLVERIKNNTGENLFANLYTVLRKDLSTDEFTAFESLNFSFTIPEETLITDENGRIKIVP